jgi:hypothetical protein
MFMNLLHCITVSLHMFNNDELCSVHGLQQNGAVELTGKYFYIGVD